MKEYIFQKISNRIKQGKKQFWILLDPERESPEELRVAGEMAVNSGADGLLIGSSLYPGDNFNEAVLAVKNGCQGVVPVLIFPGNHRQVSPHADAILFLTLLSGRNPRYLIEEQMLAAPYIHQIGLETIATGYILIESGKITSVQRVTETTPLPRENAKLIATHALTGQYLGNQMIYLEAGSGALYPVPEDAIRLTRSMIDVPLIVGGGIRDPKNAEVAVRAGADFIVIGNALENARDCRFINELADAVHRTR